MTIHGPTSRPADVPTTTVLRRAIAAEWTRLWTLRSVWWALLAAAGLFLFVGAAAGAQHDGGPAPVWQPARIAVVPGQFAFLLAALLAVGGEYSTGAIRSSLQWVPRRGIMLAARLVVPVAFVTACAVVVAAAAMLVSWAFVGPAAEVIVADIAASVGRIALVVAFGAVLTVGSSLLLRSTAGALTALFMLILALPIALGNTGVPVLVTISDHLPGRAIISTVVFEGTELAAGTIATVMIAWTSAALLAGGWSLIRRDAT